MAFMMLMGISTRMSRAGAFNPVKKASVEVALQYTSPELTANRMPITIRVLPPARSFAGSDDIDGTACGAVSDLFSDVGLASVLRSTTLSPLFERLVAVGSKTTVAE